MSEHINQTALLDSGGHVWLWGRRNTIEKRLATAAVAGEGLMTTLLGARPLTIEGRDGTAALLKGSGASIDAADAALTDLESAVEAYCTNRPAVTWEDDAGRTGDALVLLHFERIGHRAYGRLGENWAAWQEYRLYAVELDGKPL